MLIKRLCEYKMCCDVRIMFLVLEETVAFGLYDNNIIESLFVAVVACAAYSLSAPIEMFRRRHRCRRRRCKAHKARGKKLEQGEHRRGGIPSPPSPIAVARCVLVCVRLCWP